MLIKSRKPFALSLIVVIAWIVISGIFGPLFGKLTSVQENNNSSFLPKGAEATLASEEIQKFTQGTAFNFPTLILFEGKVTPEALATVNAELAGIPALTLDGTSAKIGDFLLKGEAVSAFPSQDGQAILVNVPLDGEAIGEVLPNEKPVLPAVVEALRAEVAPLAEKIGMDSYVTGPGGLLGDLFGAFGSIDSTLLLTTLAVVAIILIFVYRSPVLWIIPLLTSLFALSTAGGLIYILAKRDILDVDGQSQGILSVLVIGAATDYALLLIARYREELHHHENRFDAMRAAYKGVWEPILASGSTVAISLLILLFSQLTNTASLGPIGAIGIAVSVITILTLLPALMLIPSLVVWLILIIQFAIGLAALANSESSLLAGLVTAGITSGIFFTAIFFGIQRLRKPEWGPLNKNRIQSGRWLFWPRIPNNDGDDHVLSGSWSKVANTIARNPRKSWVITLVVLLAFAFNATTLKTDGLGTVDSFTGNPESVIGQGVLTKHFPGGEGDPTQIVVTASKIDAVTAAVKDEKGVTSVTPQLAGQVIPGQPLPPVQIVNGKAILLVTLDKAPDSVEAGEDIPAIRIAAKSADPSALVGGTSAVYFDVRTANSQDNRTIIPIILIVITIILGLLLRSLVSALVLLGTVVLSFFATLGVCALFFNHVFGFAGGDNSFPLFAFIFLVALGIDYNIFLMTRVREESTKLGTRAGVTRGVTVTGAVITSAGIVLAATFAVLGLLPLVPLAQLGFAVAFGVLLDTIVVRSILVPALVHEIGPKVWWPSKLSKQSE